MRREISGGHAPFGPRLGGVLTELLAGRGRRTNAVATNDDNILELGRFGRTRPLRLPIIARCRACLRQADRCDANDQQNLRQRSLVCLHDGTRHFPTTNHLERPPIRPGCRTPCSAETRGDHIRYGNAVNKSLKSISLAASFNSGDTPKTSSNVRNVRFKSAYICHACRHKGWA